jgi:hypothetical protein
MLLRVTLVKTDVLEELNLFIIRVIRIGELGTLTITSNRRSVRRLLVMARFANARAKNSTQKLPNTRREHYSVKGDVRRLQRIANS